MSPDRISERLILCAEIMYNRTTVGVVYDSSAPCPYPEGPCSCINGSTGTSVHTCKPWAALRFPYGSEFAFDTTGQEEVYVWARQAISAPICDLFSWVCQNPPQGLQCPRLSASTNGACAAAQTFQVAFKRFPWCQPVFCHTQVHVCICAR